MNKIIIAIALLVISFSANSADWRKVTTGYNSTDGVYQRYLLDISSIETSGNLRSFWVKIDPPTKPYYILEHYSVNCVTNKEVRVAAAKYSVNGVLLEYVGNHSESTNIESDEIVYEIKTTLCPQVIESPIPSLE